jgi:hypothetical protein
MIGGIVSTKFPDPGIVGARCIFHAKHIFQAVHFPIDVVEVGSKQSRTLIPRAATNADAQVPNVSRNKSAGRYEKKQPERNTHGLGMHVANDLCN